MKSKWVKVHKFEKNIKPKNEFDFFNRYKIPVAEEFINGKLIKYYLININKTYSFLCEYYSNDRKISSEIFSFNFIVSEILSKSKNINFFKKLTNYVLQSIEDNIFAD